MTQTYSYLSGRTILQLSIMTNKYGFILGLLKFEVVKSDELSKDKKEVPGSLAVRN